MSFLDRKPRDVADEIIESVVPRTVNKVMSDYREACRNIGQPTDGPLTDAVERFVKRSAQYATIETLKEMAKTLAN